MLFGVMELFFRVLLVKLVAVLLYCLGVVYVYILSRTLAVKAFMLKWLTVAR